MSNDLTRASRRHSARKILIKRIDKWSYTLVEEGETYADVKTAILNGVRATFLRSTSKPCSCAMCSSKKYRRDPQTARHAVLCENE